MTDWLTSAFERGKTKDVTEAEITASNTPALRGIEFICLRRLKKARGLKAVRKGEGIYLVAEPHMFEGDPSGKLSLDEWLNQPVFVQRQGVEDLDGWHSYWVNLVDPDVERCYCRDTYTKATALRTPCKHVLAALIEDNHPEILKIVSQQQDLERIAAALSQ